MGKGSDQAESNKVLRRRRVPCPTPCRWRCLMATVPVCMAWIRIAIFSFSFQKAPTPDDSRAHVFSITFPLGRQDEVMQFISTFHQRNCSFNNLHDISSMMCH